MPIVCLTVVGKSNEPLFIYTEADESGTLQLHSIVHCSLDIVEERRGKRPASSTSSDMYLGQLYPVEDYRVYGYITNTMLKIIMVCESNTPETDLKELFQKIHKNLVGVIQNPFQKLSQPLTSQKFQSKVKQMIKVFNTNEPKFM